MSQKETVKGGNNNADEEGNTLRSVATIFAMAVVFLFVGHQLGAHTAVARRAASNVPYAGRRGLRGPAVANPERNDVVVQTKIEWKPAELPPTAPDYTSTQCKASPTYATGLSCPVPPEVEAAQRETAEHSLNQLPWMKVYEKNPKMKTDGKGRLVVEDWNPPEGYMLEWAKKTVKDALQPWDSYIDPFQYDSFKVRAHGRKGCSLQIKGGSSERCSYGGSNGRYEKLIKEALSHLKKQGKTPKDSKMIMTGGDDEPSVPKMADKASLSIPLVASQQNNGRFYDFVMPTITRSAFIGASYYNEGLSYIKKSKKFEERVDGLVWRGSRGCSYGCGKLGQYFYPDRDRGETCHSDKGWTYSSPHPKGNNISYSQSCREHPRAMLVGYSEAHPKCVDAALTGKHIDNRIHFADFKFVVNVGNNGFADRVKILLSMGNVIFFHTSGWKEWYYSALVPWVHYVPVMHDFSDLCEKHELLSRSPEAAATISRNAQKFFKDNLRPADKNDYVGEFVMQWGDLWDKLVTQKTPLCPVTKDSPVAAACSCSSDLGDAAEGPNCYAGQYCIDGKGVPYCFDK